MHVNRHTTEVQSSNLLACTEEQEWSEETGGIHLYIKSILFTENNPCTGYIYLNAFISSSGLGFISQDKLNAIKAECQPDVSDMGFGR